MGLPDSFYESGESKYLTYIKSRTTVIPGRAPTYRTQIIGNTAYTRRYGGTANYNWQRSCKTAFTIVGSKVTDYRYEGNNCTAK